MKTGKRSRRESIINADILKFIKKGNQAVWVVYSRRVARKELATLGAVAEDT